jgi:hypothetical protein
LELLDGLTTDTDTEDFVTEFNLQTNFFQATKTLSVKDFQPKEAGVAFDRIRLKIMRGEVHPDEGTLKDIRWLSTYVEFGQFVQMAYPDWAACDRCHQTRLCIHSVRDLSRVCYECRYKERVMEDVAKGEDLTSEAVRDFLQTGNLDPSVHWKTYAQLVRDQLDDFHRRREDREITKELWNGPYIPLKRMNNGI